MLGWRGRGTLGSDVQGLLGACDWGVGSRDARHLGNLEVRPRPTSGSLVFWLGMSCPSRGVEVVCAVCMLTGDTQLEGTCCAYPHRWRVHRSCCLCLHHQVVLHVTPPAGECVCVCVYTLEGSAAGNCVPASGVGACGCVQLAIAFLCTHR